MSSVKTDDFQFECLRCHKFCTSAKNLKLHLESSLKNRRRKSTKTWQEISQQGDLGVSSYDGHDGHGGHDDDDGNVDDLVGGISDEYRDSEGSFYNYGPQDELIKEMSAKDDGQSEVKHGARRPRSLQPKQKTSRPKKYLAKQKSKERVFRRSPNKSNAQDLSVKIPKQNFKSVSFEKEPSSSSSSFRINQVHAVNGGYNEELVGGNQAESAKGLNRKSFD